MAHTGPVYVAPGGRYDLRDAATEQYLLTLIGGGLEYLRAAAPRYPDGEVTHAHGAGTISPGSSSPSTRRSPPSGLAGAAS